MWVAPVAFFPDRFYLLWLSLVTIAFNWNCWFIVSVKSPWAHTSGSSGSLNTQFPLRKDFKEL